MALINGERQTNLKKFYYNFVKLQRWMVRFFKKLHSSNRSIAPVIHSVNNEFLKGYDINHTLFIKGK